MLRDRAVPMSAVTVVLDSPTLPPHLPIATRDKKIEVDCKRLR